MKKDSVMLWQSAYIELSSKVALCRKKTAFNNVIVGSPIFTGTKGCRLMKKESVACLKIDQKQWRLFF